MIIICLCLCVPCVRSHNKYILARDAQAKLALIVAQRLPIHLSICVSVRDSLSHGYVRSIARRKPRRLPACLFQVLCCVIEETSLN